MTFDFEFAFRFPAAIILIVYSKLTQELTNKLTKKLTKLSSEVRGRRALYTSEPGLHFAFELSS